MPSEGTRGLAVTTERDDPHGAQPNDPAWARLLFLLVQGRDGQWWRAILLMVPVLLLVAVLAMIMAELPVASWLGLFGVSTAVTGGVLARSRRHRTHARTATSQDSHATPRASACTGVSAVSACSDGSFPSPWSSPVLQSVQLSGTGHADHESRPQSFPHV